MYYKTKTAVLAALIILFLILTAAEYTRQYKFEGASRCGLCHSSADIGNQYDTWKSSGHSNAYLTLFSEKALDYAKDAGIAAPSKNDQCLKCHLTGHGAPFRQMGPMYRKEDGVSCEGCHGSGGGYAYFSIMTDRELAVKKGLAKNPENSCVECHSGKCPFDIDTPFKFETSMEKIRHPRPK
ncbi:MAG: cytochrome C554 [Deltaproteobacteria bacterium]|uniref:Cytochrome C554 n=1 Tax=Candidatus Zymogenus saltonus TaxID=2844893 RepID=A0A9D8PPD9_9DELT|nr:cytochrome C554 [Candidatus Zymogenus saltonus]